MPSASTAARPPAAITSRLVAIVLVVLCSLAHADGLLDGLSSDDKAKVAAAVTAIEQAPPDTPELADTLFAAARACEDTLVDPARALALYERIVREQPDARVVIAASRRAEALRALVGRGGEHAQQARDFAQLVDQANALAADEVVRRADALATAAWPGAPEAALWLAERSRSAQRFEEAQARYRTIAERWPGSPHATLAIRGAAGAALEQRDWDGAERLAGQLPEIEPADRIVRDDLFATAARGRARERWYAMSWIGVVAAFALLLGSLVEASLRGGRRLPRLRPPVEVLYLAPLGGVLVAVAFTGHSLIAPAVMTVVFGGLGLAWLSGAALETARARGRSVRARGLAHVLISFTGVASLFYIAITRENLLEMVIETIRFGPE